MWIHLYLNHVVQYQNYWSAFPRQGRCPSTSWVTPQRQRRARSCMTSWCLRRRSRPVSGLGSSSKVSPLPLRSSPATITARSQPLSTVTSIPLSLVSRTLAFSPSPASWQLRHSTCFLTAWQVFVLSTSRLASGVSSHRRLESTKCSHHNLWTRLSSKHCSGQTLPPWQSNHGRN